MQRRFDKESTGTFRTVKFVRADGNQIGVELVDIFKRLLAETLHSIGVKNNFGRAADFTERGNGLKQEKLFSATWTRSCSGS